MISHWQIYTIHITAGSDQMDCLSALCLLFQGVQVFYDRLSLGLCVRFLFLLSLWITNVRKLQMHTQVVYSLWHWSSRWSQLTSCDLRQMKLCIPEQLLLPIIYSKSFCSNHYSQGSTFCLLYVVPDHQHPPRSVAAEPVTVGLLLGIGAFIFLEVCMVKYFAITS